MHSVNRLNDRRIGPGVISVVSSTLHLFLCMSHVSPLFYSQLVLAVNAPPIGLIAHPADGVIGQQLKNWDDEEAGRCLGMGEHPGRMCAREEVVSRSDREQSCSQIGARGWGPYHERRFEGGFL